MKIIFFVFSFVLMLISQETEDTEMSNFIISSKAFANKSNIPVDYSCEGADQSPPLSWNNAPANTKGYALTCVDPDAPMGDWIHWTIWNIPANFSELSSGISNKEQTLFQQGLNSWGKPGYGGPCPPRGHGPHRYFFKLYALNIEKIELDSNSRIDSLLSVIQDYIINTSELMGTFERE